MVAEILLKKAMG